MTSLSTAKETLARRIAGEIILSNMPGTTLKKWRETFGISQSRIAEKLGISPSVISDYESGRRKSPGTTFVRHFVESIIAIDGELGGRFLRELTRLTASPSDAVLDIREFPMPTEGTAISEATRGTPLACEELLSRKVYGYTVIDSIRAIQTLSGADFYQLFGSTTERAAIFTNVTTGRSPLVAVRVHPLKPRIIVLQGTSTVDKLAVRLAEAERIPLVLSRISTVDELLLSLSRFYETLISGTSDRGPKQRNCQA